MVQPRAFRRMRKACLPRQIVQFRQKPVAHGMYFAQGRLTARGLVRQPDVVMDIHDIVADAMYGAGMPSDERPRIFHDAVTLRRRIGQHARPVPEIKEKAAARLQMATGGLQHGKGVFFRILVTHHMEQTGHGVKPRIEPNGPRIAFQQAGRRHAGRQIRRGGQRLTAHFQHGGGTCPRR